MIRKKKRAPILLIGWLIAMVVTACAAPTPIPAPAPTPKPIDPRSVDLKPFLREFLANLPANEHLLASQDLAQMKPVIVDVRQPDEYAQGFIAGAINIPLRDLAQNLRALPALDKAIVVVCNSGHRAAIGMAVLQMLGYKNAKSLAGGLQAWQAAKLALVTTPVPPRPAGQAPTVNAQLHAALDYYLVHTLPFDWGVLDTPGLTADQKLLPSSASEAMPETYDQGPSLLIDVDTPEEFGKSVLANFQRALNIPLPHLPDELETMPLQQTIDYA